MTAVGRLQQSAARKELAGVRRAHGNADARFWIVHRHPSPASRLEFASPAMDIAGMILTGHIQNGAVVLDGNPVLPEGAPVTVSIPTTMPARPETRRVQIPLVRTGEAGSLNLTNERLAAHLEDDDIAFARR